MSGKVWGFALVGFGAGVAVGVFMGDEIEELFATPEDTIMIDNGEIHVDVPEEVDTIVVDSAGWKPGNMFIMNVQPRDNKRLYFRSRGGGGFLDVDATQIVVDNAMVGGATLKSYNVSNGTPPPEGSSRFSLEPAIPNAPFQLTFIYGVGNDAASWEVDRSP